MTKGELASRVLKLIGVNSRFAEADPSETQDTLKYMEDWILANNAVGRRIGYIVSDGEPQATEDSGIPGWAVMGVTNSVAMYVAPYFEKMIHPAIPRNASMGMQTIANRTAEAEPVQYPGRFPRGQGNHGLYGAKYYHPYERVITHNDFLSDENDTPVTP
jgi:hypothetical protein